MLQKLKLSVAVIINYFSGSFVNEFERTSDEGEDNDDIYIIIPDLLHHTMTLSDGFDIRKSTNLNYLVH